MSLQVLQAGVGLGAALKLQTETDQMLLATLLLLSCIKTRRGCQFVASVTEKHFLINFFKIHKQVLLACFHTRLGH